APSIIIEDLKLQKIFHTLAYLVWNYRIKGCLLHTLSSDCNICPPVPEIRTFVLPSGIEGAII
ncbi:hypothetical protein NE673_15350, partial [Blautia producta]|uniref:hypothetical protein n=1 Tax=Blautia producta TaxID=33035 RepID=UPI001D08BDA9